MLKGAIIGLGNIAVRGHVPAFQSSAIASRASIVAVMDLVEENRKLAATLFPEARVYATLDALIAGEQLDFVDICTPPHTHAAIVRACAAKGWHILCEKPLAHDPASGEELAAAVRAAGVVFVPCHQYKYSPLWKTIHDLLASGRIGRPTVAQFNVYRLQADTGNAGWNPAWRTDKKQSGGGILVDTGAHYLYLAQYFFGLPLRVSSVLRTLKHEQYGVEDTALVTLEYPSLILQLNLTWAAGQRANSLFIAGTEGGIAYDGARLTLTTAAGAEEIPMPNISDKNQYVAWYASLLAEFFGRIESGNRAHDLLEEALHVMSLLRCSAASSDQQRMLEYQ